MKLKNRNFRRNSRLDVVIDFSMGQDARRSLNKRKKKSCYQHLNAFGVSDVEASDKDKYRRRNEKNDNINRIDRRRHVKGSGQNINKDGLKHTNLQFINCNVQSLVRKMDALADYFSEKRLDFALLTKKTWFQSDKFNEDRLADFTGKYELSSLVRHR